MEDGTNAKCTQKKRRKIHLHFTHTKKKIAQVLRIRFRVENILRQC